MKNITKRSVAAIASAVMIISSAVSVSAEDYAWYSDSDVIKYHEEISLEDFVNDSIHTGLELCDFDYGNYSISNLIPVYNFETNDFCNYKTFVLSGENVVAEMDIWIDENNNYISSFSDEIDDNINMFKNGTALICYGIYDGEMWLCANNTDFYKVKSNETINPDEKVNIFKTNVIAEYSVGDSNETNLNLAELKECKDL